MISPVVSSVIMKWRSYLAVAATLFVLLAFLAPYVNHLLLPGTRFYVGEHRTFFLRCASLARGATTSQVLDAMRGYTLGASNKTIDSQLATVTVPTRDDSARRFGADSSLLILPEKPDPADWCVCYFRSGRLVKTVVSPD